MVEALEEQASTEVIDHDSTIEALKKEVELLKDERARLVGEVENLHAAQSGAESLRG